MKVKQESGKFGLKLDIQKTKMIASSPITSCQIDAEKMETVTDFIFLGSRITVNNDCSHEIKRHLLLGRKAILDSVLKSREITLLTKVHIVKAVVFSSSHVWMWELNHRGRLRAEELMLLNCGAGEDSWESLEQQGDQASQSQGKSTLNIHWKDWSWSFSILVIWYE